jgi:ABC-type uncharacterized transport system substrate-binding protein
MSNPVFLAGAARLSRLALAVGLPMICAFREMTEKGCLIGYPAKSSDLRQRTALFARILQGAPVGERPIEEPKAFALTLNLKPPRRSASRSLSRSVPALTR